MPVRSRQLPEIDEFQRIEGLSSRADALALIDARAEAPKPRGPYKTKAGLAEANSN